MDRSVVSRPENSSFNAAELNQLTDRLHRQALRVPGAARDKVKTTSRVEPNLSPARGVFGRLVKRLRAQQQSGRTER